MSEFQRIMKEKNKTAEEKKKQSEEDQRKMTQNKKGSNIMTDHQLKQLEKNTGGLPPYLENISKDVMINRKMKILLEKSNSIFMQM